MTEIFFTRRAATRENVAWLRRSMRRAFASLRLASEISDDLELVFGEAAENVLSHSRISPEYLELRLDLLGGHICLCLEDDGSGWSNAHAALDAATKPADVEAESGRGLWLMRQALDRVQYAHRVEGAKFNRFRGWKSLAPKRPTVLIVDDIPALLEIYAKYLAADCRTLVASSLAEAAGVLRSCSVDIVLADLHLGDGLGHQLTDKLAGSQADAPPVVLISSDSSAQSRNEGLRGGAEFFISKPVRRQDLRETIQLALERARTRDARLARSFARHVDGLVDNALPRHIGEYAVMSTSESASPGGGDMLLHFLNSERKRIVIVDVMGHGVPARAWAIAYAATMRTVQYCRPELDPGGFLTELAHMSWNDPGLQNAMATVLVCDLTDTGIVYASAGHPGPILHAGSMKSFGIGGPLLGVMPPGAYASTAIPIERGDRLYLLTDGLDPADVAAGGPAPEWFTDAVSQGANRIPAESFALLREAVANALGPQPADDWTLVQIERVD